METKISKAQLDVWEMKERAYEEIKDMTLSEAVRFIHEQTKDTIAQIEKNRAIKKAAEVQTSCRDLEQKH